VTTWFITGTSSGFGRILTEQLLERGDRVAATLRRPEALEDLRATAGGRLWTTQLDVTHPDDVQRVVDTAFTELGTIEVVVNNAGYGLFAGVEEASRQQVERVLATNLTGSIDVIRAAVPHLRAQGHGRILQVSSAGGQTTYPGFAYYHAAKWGIEGFCEAIAPELAHLGLGITIVEPGATPTGFSAGVDRAPMMSEYDTGPVGDVRRAVASGAFRITNDPVAIAAAIIASVDVSPAPLRLPLGDDTYRDVRAAYVARLDHLDSSRQLALSVAGA
jgi:NAD(P)-dependent dehydrogenase (short-subunit alcohol dehydrogenase family)